MNTYAARPLRRSSRHRWIGGVVGGLADYLGLSPTLLRAVYVAVSLASSAFPGMLVYVILWIAMPRER